jgi:hypothetical protein
MVFTHISPVYYDKRDGRLYHFEGCYASQSPDNNKTPPPPFCPEDEGVATPNPDYPRK